MNVDAKEGKVHLAVKFLVNASQSQQGEVCVSSVSPSHHPRISHLTQVYDGTKTVIILAGELLKQAENLLIMGLHPSEISKGYELACGKALGELQSTFLLFYPIPLASFILSNVNTFINSPINNNPPHPTHTSRPH